MMSHFKSSFCRRENHLVFNDLFFIKRNEQMKRKKNSSKTKCHSQYKFSLAIVQSTIQFALDGIFRGKING